MPARAWARFVDYFLYSLPLIVRHISPYLPISPYISLCLHISHYFLYSLPLIVRHISPYLPISPYISLCLHISHYFLYSLPLIVRAWRSKPDPDPDLDPDPSPSLSPSPSPSRALALSRSVPSAPPALRSRCCCAPYLPVSPYVSLCLPMSPYASMLMCAMARVGASPLTLPLALAPRPVATCSTASTW